MGIDLQYEKKALRGSRYHTNPGFISFPFLKIKGEVKDCRGEGSAKQKVTMRRGISEIRCAACTVGNHCALKIKSI